MYIRYALRQRVYGTRYDRECMVRVTTESVWYTLRQRVYGTRYGSECMVHVTTESVWYALRKRLYGKRPDDSDRVVNFALK